jgi:hypothetical protein
VTSGGLEFISSLGADLSSSALATHQHGAFCRPCLDWSERRPHLAGTVGRLMYDAFARRGWVRRVPHSRAVSISPVGELELKGRFGLLLSRPI